MFQGIRLLNRNIPLLLQGRTSSFVRMASNFTIPNTECKVNLTSDLTKEELLAFPAFKVGYFSVAVLVPKQKLTWRNRTGSQLSRAICPFKPHQTMNSMPHLTLSAVSMSKPSIALVLASASSKYLPLYRTMKVLLFQERCS